MSDARLVPSDRGLSGVLGMPLAPPIELVEGRYRVRFARDAAELEAAQRLRFEVFNLELGEGLVSSRASGLDRDPFDAFCHHLLLFDAAGAVVGTYRLQTLELARAGIGFYCASEFALDAVPAGVLADAVELGRACIAARHRHGHALYALWRGLAAYASWSGKRYLFGCSSLTSQDPALGQACARLLARRGHVHPELSVPVLAPYACDAPGGAAREADVEIPRLFAAYLRYGARVCGGPALDRAFKTIDFLTVLDLTALETRLARMFFAGFLVPWRAS